MKATALVILLLVAANMVLAHPLEEHFREKRFSCDIKITADVFGVKITDTGCNIRCFLERRPGGTCDSHKKCHCR
ncbi:Tenecin-1 [Blattella germanica]|nr:Tenecin-1 [Blattella germanica]PSN36809.1 Tenecin-1 [Blattella germanica]